MILKPKLKYRLKSFMRRNHNNAQIVRILFLTNYFETKILLRNKGAYYNTMDI